MSVTYYTASGQSAFNVAVTVGLPVWDTPIPALADQKLVFRQEHMQTAASYSPLALSTTYTAHGTYGVPTSSSYFLVGEENFRNVGGGVLQWERVWARVPPQWYEYEDYAYTYPAYVAPISIGTGYSIIGITDVGSTTYVRIQTAATGISANDTVYVACTYSRGAGAIRAVNMITRVLNASSTQWVEVAHVFVGTGTTYAGASGEIIKVGGGRSTPETIAVSSRIAHEYANISNPASITATLETVLPLIDGFTAIDSIGQRTTTLSTGTASRPNSVTYAAMINEGIEIVAEQSVRERWMGNIYVRKTRFIPAR